jgi:hypothetical protein
MEGQRRCRGALILILTAIWNSVLVKEAPCRAAGALRKAAAPEAEQEIILILSRDDEFASRLVWDDFIHLAESLCWSCLGSIAMKLSVDQIGAVKEGSF